MDQSITPVLRRGKKERSLPACVALGTLGSLALLLGLALLFTVLAYNNDNPGAWVMPLSYLASLAAAFGGGLISARLRRRQGLICGLLTGVGVLLLYAVGLMILSGESDLQAGRILLTYLLLLAMAVLGGVLGGVRVAKPRRRRR